MVQDALPASPHHSHQHIPLGQQLERITLEEVSGVWGEEWRTLVRVRRLSLRTGEEERRWLWQWRLKSRRQSSDANPASRAR